MRRYISGEFLFCSGAEEGEDVELCVRHGWTFELVLNTHSRQLVECVMSR